MGNGNRSAGFSVKEVIREALGLYRANFLLFIFLSFLIQGIGFFNQVYSTLGAGYNFWLVVAVSLINLVVFYWAFAALLVAIAKKYSGQAVTVKEAFLDVRTRVWRFACMTWFAGLIVLAGYFLFVLPGIYWSVIFSLAGIVILLENFDFYAALNRSRELVRGHFWKFFGLGAVMFAIYSVVWLIYFLKTPFLIKIILGGGCSLLFAPVSAGVLVIAYYKLTGIQAPSETRGQEIRLKGMGCLGCLGMIGLAVGIMVLSIFWLRSGFLFLKSERGLAAFEWVARQVSPPIQLRGMTVIERPTGYWVIKREQPPEMYFLQGMIEGELFSFQVVSLSFKELSLDEASFNLDDGSVLKNYYAYLRQMTVSVPDDNLPTRSAAEALVNGRRWVEYRFRLPARAKGAAQWTRVYYFAVDRGQVLSVSYSYSDRLDPARKETIEKEARKIIENI